MNKIMRRSCAALVVCMACGPQQGLESATDGASSDASSGGPGTTGSEPTGGGQPMGGSQPTGGESSAGESSAGDSTDANAECPGGPAPLSALWTAAGESVWEDNLALGESLVALADGRLAVTVMSVVEAGKTAPGLIFLSATGEPLGTHLGAFTNRSFQPYTVAVDAADQPVVLSMTQQDGAKSGLLSRFASDGTVLGEVELEFPAGRGVLALADVPVVAGFDLGSEKLWVAKVDPTTGTPLWQSELVASKFTWVGGIAVGPQGDIVVAGHTALVSEAGPQILVWRFTGDGAPVWTRVIATDGPEQVTDLQFTPDGQLLVLHGGGWPHPRVALMALGSADAATLWQRVVAEPTISNGGPWSEGFHIADGEVTVPITRVRAPSLGDPGRDRSLEVHRFSLQGEPLSVTAVAGPGSPDGPAQTQSVIGQCGQLVLFAPDELDAIWLTGLAP